MEPTTKKSLRLAGVWGIAVDEAGAYSWLLVFLYSALVEPVDGNTFRVRPLTDPEIAAELDRDPNVAFTDVLLAPFGRFAGNGLVGLHARLFREYPM